MKHEIKNRFTNEVLFSYEYDESQSSTIDRIALEKAIKDGVDLCGANLSRANLIDTNLSGADLSDANLSSVNLIGANLHNTDLSGTNLYCAKLSVV